MRNIWLIARREYLERVRTRSFMVMTVLIPLLMVGGLIGNALYNGKQDAEAVVDIVVSDHYLDFASAVQAELRQRGGHPRVVADVISPPQSDTQKTLTDDLKSKDLDAYLWIEQDGVHPAAAWVSRSKNAKLRQAVFSAVDHVAAKQNVGISSAKIQVKEAGGSADSAYFGALAFFFMMYFVIMMYGMNVARSIIEEKTSRVFEVLLATIRPEEMMAGKVIGVGGVGLTQVAIWVVIGGILSATPFLANVIGTSVQFHLSVLQMASFVGFFLLGYLLYSAIAAALGAMTNSEQELQQMNMFLALPMALNMFTLGIILSSPNGLYSTLISFIPFCTPLTMYLRLSLGTVPPWQVALAIGELLFFVWVFLWIASRIYRVGILMYGKKPSLAEILRWLKYS